MQIMYPSFFCNGLYGLKSIKVYYNIDYYKNNPKYHIFKFSERKITVKRCNTIIFSIYLTKLMIFLILSKSDIAIRVSSKKRSLCIEIFVAFKVLLSLVAEK